MRFDPGTRVIVVPVQLAGPSKATERDLVLDTGASYVMVASRVLEDIGYAITDMDRTIRVTTASGIEDLPLVKLDAVTALGVTVHGVEAVCHDLPAGSGVDGLLGLSFLRHLDLNLHLRSGVIEAVTP